MKGGEGELRVGFANVREGENTKDVSSEHISKCRIALKIAVIERESTEEKSEILSWLVKHLQKLFTVFGGHIYQLESILHKIVGHVKKWNAHSNVHLALGSTPSPLFFNCILWYSHCVTKQ